MDPALTGGSPCLPRAAWWGRGSHSQGSPSRSGARGTSGGRAADDSRRDTQPSQGHRMLSERPLPVPSSHWADCWGSPRPRERGTSRNRPGPRKPMRSRQERGLPGSGARQIRVICVFSSPEKANRPSGPSATAGRCLPRLTATTSPTRTNAKQVPRKPGRPSPRPQERLEPGTGHHRRLEPARPSPCPSHFLERRLFPAYGRAPPPRMRDTRPAALAPPLLRA